MCAGGEAGQGVAAQPEHPHVAGQQPGLFDPAGLPVAGVQTARKPADETLPSDTLMARWAGSESL